MENFKIFNSTEITFNWKARLEILLGKKVNVHLTIEVDRDVEVIQDKTKVNVTIR